MPNAKVMAGSTRLKQTIRVLQDQWLVTEATWSDSVRRRFEERYLAPLEPAVDSAMNGMAEDRRGARPGPPRLFRPE